MTRQRRWTIPTLVVSGLTLVAPIAGAQIRDLQDRTLIADDGTAFVVTTAIVRVPEERSSAGAGARTVDLAVVLPLEDSQPLHLISWTHPTGCRAASR